MSYFKTNNLNGYKFVVTNTSGDDTFNDTFTYDGTTGNDTFNFNGIGGSYHFVFDSANGDEYTFIHVDEPDHELVIDISGTEGGTVEGFDIGNGEDEWQLLEGTYQDNEGNVLQTFDYSGGGHGGVPCLTETCNILTPNGYQNVSSLNVGDIVTTSDNRNVAIKEIFTSKVLTSQITPRVIRAHQYGKNQPIIDTHLSDWHAYQVNGVWKLPKKEKLTKEWNDRVVTFYHLKLPNYTQDFLVVNGITMEGWDGYQPKEFRPFKWVKEGKGFVLKKL